MQSEETKIETLKNVSLQNGQFISRRAIVRIIVGILLLLVLAHIGFYKTYIRHFPRGNGDEFYTSFTGTSTPGPYGTSTIVVNHTITGGTGRFSDATGTFTGDTIANPALPTGTITYDGTISY